MKKSTKIWILIAGACMGVGILLCIIAVFVAGFQFSKLDTTEKKEEKHYTISSDNIKNLTVSTAATDVEVRPGSSPDIEITCYENKKEYFDIETVEDSLNITEKNKEKWFHIQISFLLFRVCLLLPPCSCQDNSGSDAPMPPCRACPLPDQ